MARKHLPYLTFFTSDYVQDTRILSLEARAVWMDLLCLLHDGDRRGYLTRNGSALTPAQVARFCGCPEVVAAAAIDEIVRAGVASVDEKGVLFCRRMLREEQLSKVRSANGMRGGRPRSEKLNESKTKAKVKQNTGDGDGYGSSLETLKGEETTPEELDSSGVGGVGGGGPEVIPIRSAEASLALPPARPSPSAEACRLADLWCFHLARRFRSGPADLADDLAPQFDELFRLGYHPRWLETMILRKQRDKSEHFWQFKKFIQPTDADLCRLVGTDDWTLHQLTDQGSGPNAKLFFGT